MITLGWNAAGGYTATTFGFMLLVGFGEGNWGCIGPLLNEVFPTSVRAAALGIIYNTARGVQFLAPMIIAMVAARFTFGAGIALAVPFALLAGAMVWTLPETKGVRLMEELANAQRVGGHPLLQLEDRRLGRGADRFVGVHGACRHEHRVTARWPRSIPRTYPSDGCGAWTAACSPTP